MMTSTPIQKTTTIRRDGDVNRNFQNGQTDRPLLVLGLQNA